MSLVHNRNFKKKQNFTILPIFFLWWYILVKSNNAPCSRTILYHIGDTFYKRANPTLPVSPWWYNFVTKSVIHFCNDSVSLTFTNQSGDYISVTTCFKLKSIWFFQSNCVPNSFFKGEQRFSCPFFCTSQGISLLQDFIT